jgi:hypothetical protein
LEKQKQLLISIRRSKHITSRQVADKAHVPLSTEYTAEIGGLVSKEDAERVLEAFSELAGMKYTLENVQVNLKHAVEV